MARGVIAMMLCIAIEERERESHRLPLPPSSCARKCSIYVEKKRCSIRVKKGQKKKVSMER